MTLLTMLSVSDHRVIINIFFDGIYRITLINIITKFE